MRGTRLSRRALVRFAAAPFLAGLVPGAGARAAASDPQGPLHRMRAAFYRFATAPFPYRGRIPTGEKFLDTEVDGRLGHESPRGGLYFADTTYSDNRVLLAMPTGFDPSLPAMLVLYFHGNQATLERDVVGRDRVLSQLQASRLNAALIAPQLAVDALDSSAGKFWQRGALARFLAEASGNLADLWGDPNMKKRFAELPVVLVAFSGGYDPLVFGMSLGGASRRIAGIVLLDALYDEFERFADWIKAHNRSAFFLSAYSDDLEVENATLRDLLDERRVRFSTGLPKQLVPGEVAFLETPGRLHRDYVRRAWVRNPLTDVMNRIPGYPRG